MKPSRLPMFRVTILSLAAAGLLIPARAARAHCDGLDGPVVRAAQKALTETNVNLVLIWVHQDAAPEIERAFARTLAVRRLGGEARQLADLYFFETLVRVHRAGEGAAYTGLKPAGRDLGPAISAGDKALETGDVTPVRALLAKQLEHGLEKRFAEVMARKKFAVNDAAAGREFVRAYVEYIHYVEGLHRAAAGGAEPHGEAHDTAASPHEHPEHP